LLQARHADPFEVEQQTSSLAEAREARTAIERAKGILWSRRA
jgi:hypothetical protein